MKTTLKFLTMLGLEILFLWIKPTSNKKSYALRQEECETRFGKLYGPNMMEEYHGAMDAFSLSLSSLSMDVA